MGCVSAATALFSLALLGSPLTHGLQNICPFFAVNMNGAPAGVAQWIEHLPVFHSQLTEAQCVCVAGARPQSVCVALEATLSGAVRCGGRNRARVQVCLRLLEILL